MLTDDAGIAKVTKFHLVNFKCNLEWDMSILTTEAHSYLNWEKCGVHWIKVLLVIMFNRDKKDVFRFDITVNDVQSM